MRVLVAVFITLTTAAGVPAQERTLRGRVVDAGSAVPLAHARVTAVLTPERTGITRNPVVETDSRGEFTLALPATTTAVRITKATYALATVTVPAMSERVEVRLAPGAVITGRVLDTNGAPNVGLNLHAIPLDRNDSGPSESSVYTAFSDERGEFRIGGLPAGRYRVNTNLQGGEPSAPVTLRPGEQVDVPLSRTPAAQCRASSFPSAPPTQTGSVIKGRVLNASGIPMACTSVRLGPVSAQLPDPAEFLSRSELQVVTDAQGRFEFTAVPEGIYSVYAYRQGHARAREGPIEVPARRTNDQPAPVVADVTVRLLPGGVITGVVSDAAGEPIQSSLVLARQVRLVDGHGVSAGSSSSVLTDDRGRFRLFGLDRGHWLVSSGDGSEVTTAIPFYYPGTSDSRLAVPIDVVGSEIHDDIDIQWNRIEGVTLSGEVIDATGLPMTRGANATLDVSYRSGAMKTPRLPRAVVDGRFEFDNVPPGDYVVQVGRNTGRTWEFGRALVSVGDTAPAPLSIRTTEGASVSGTVRLDDGSAPAALVRVRLMPVDLDDAPAGILSADPTPVGDDEFRVEHVVGANRFVLTNAPVGWYLKSARIAGRETVEQPFDFGFGGEPIRDVEIVVSQAAASVSGTLRDRDAARRGYTTVVFSTNPQDWYLQSPRVRFAHSTRDGRYSVTGIPPGTYYVAALPVLDDVTMWESEASLNGLIGTAERLTLSEGDTRDVMLRAP